MIVANTAEVNSLFTLWNFFCPIATDRAVAPPTPIVRPMALYKLYIGKAMFSAAKPNSPILCPINMVSNNIHTDKPNIPATEGIIYFLNNVLSLSCSKSNFLLIVPLLYNLILLK